jgi:ATP-dependent helicase/DNAse subunit B
LFERWPELTQPDGPKRLRDRIAAAGVRPLPWRDDTGPPLLLTGEAGGGTAVIESQSACPFQAFARHRLNARAWEEPDEGLTPKERGTLLHFAMRAFWDDVRDHATLVALDAAALEARVGAAVHAARGKLPAPRWRALAPAIAAGEAQRLTQTIIAWLTLYERPRPPFRVLLTERDAPLTLGGVRLRLKIDRADTLEPGDVAVIDYKSGRVTAPGAWFRARPEGTQLGLYVVALKAAVPTRPVSAAAYAQIKAGQIRVSGVVKERDLWEDLTPPGKAMKEARAWRDLEAFWMETLTALGEAFQRGEAGVTPRNAQACQRCDLQALCRIRNLYDDAVREPVVTDEDE